ADGGDFSRLFAAENVAGAANFKIFRGDAESGAEVGELLNRGETLARVAAEDAIARNQQIAERESIAASDTAAQLVELRESESLCVIDEDRIARRDVDAVLDDRRSEQQIEFATDERRHHALELALVHLSMSDRDSQARH